MIVNLFVIEKVNVRGTDPNILWLHQQMKELRSGYYIYVYHSDRKREIDKRIKLEGLKVNCEFHTVPCEHWLYRKKYIRRKKKDIGVK
jgi:hypothetical protein